MEAETGMCGRFALTTTWSELARTFDLTPTVKPPVEPAPRYNIAPTQPILVIHADGGGTRVPLLVRWGLVPSWVEDPAAFTLLINARGETAATKPSFRTAMRHRRTLVPASGFYEWRRYANGSQPFWVRPREGGVIGFAGLMETYADANGSEIDTGCIVTTEANESFAAIHSRLPVVIAPGDYEEWLDCRANEPRDVQHLLRAVDDDFFEAVPVGSAVNKVANTSPDIQKREDPRPEPAPQPEQMKLF